MPKDNTAWHTRIGMFCILKPLLKIKSNIRMFLLPCCGNIEKKSWSKIFIIKFLHLNLNGLIAHDSIKISLFQAYLTQNNYGIMYLSEMFLNASIETNDDRITTDGYNLITVDHPSNSKRGGVCIYYKEHIPLIKRDEIFILDNC